MINDAKMRRRHLIYFLKKKIPSHKKLKLNGGKKRKTRPSSILFATKCLFWNRSDIGKSLKANSINKKILLYRELRIKIGCCFAPTQRSYEAINVVNNYW